MTRFHIFNQRANTYDIGRLGSTGKSRFLKIHCEKPTALQTSFLYHTSHWKCNSKSRCN